MAKGQVSEHDLESSLRTIGGLGAITSTGARRDSPFGSDFIRKSASTAHESEVEVSTIATAPANETLTEALKPETPQSGVPKRNVTIASQAKHPEAGDEEEEAHAAKTSGENVTIRMSQQMRDDVNYLAKKLQRRRTSKVQRITANTVMRVAIQFLLEEMKLKDTDIANTEEELLDLMRRKVLREKRSSKT